MRTADSVGGCSCPASGGCGAVSYGDVPADSRYYITTFGGGGDTQGMSCGGTADGKWAYIAGRERFGCGAKVQVSANGKSCITLVADCGPNRCVEQAACFCKCNGHFPIIDASPFITRHLFGISSSGWSEKRVVIAKVVDRATDVGCPGGPIPCLTSGKACPGASSCCAGLVCDGTRHVCAAPSVDASAPRDLAAPPDATARVDAAATMDGTAPEDLSSPLDEAAGWTDGTEWLDARAADGPLADGEAPAVDGRRGEDGAAPRGDSAVGGEPWGGVLEGGCQCRTSGAAAGEPAGVLALGLVLVGAVGLRSRRRARPRQRGAVVPTTQRS